MIERLPERVRTPEVARAVTSPSAVLLAGAGASAAILAGLPVAAAAVVGALAWAGRVALAVPRRPKGERIDPFAIGEPWRRFVRDAMRAQSAFERTVQQCRPGPVQERLALVGRRIGDGVTECWRIARQGNALEKALRQLDVEGIRRELAEVAEERRRQRGNEAAQAALARTQAAVESQLASAERLQRVSGHARGLALAQVDLAVVLVMADHRREGPLALRREDIREHVVAVGAGVVQQRPCVSGHAVLVQGLDQRVGQRLDLAPLGRDLAGIGEPPVEGHARAEVTHLLELRPDAGAFLFQLGALSRVGHVGHDRPV
jgi:hypothetical protein